MGMVVVRVIRWKHLWEIDRKKGNRTENVIIWLQMTKLEMGLKGWE